MIRIETILGILGILISLPGIASVFPYLDPPARTLVLLALACAAVGVRTRKALKGFLPTILTTGFFIYYGLQFSRDNFINPAVNLLVILLAVRLAGEKSTRNYLQMFALSLFVLAGSSLFSLGAMFLVYLVLLLILIAVALVILTFYTADNSITLEKGQLRRVFSVSLLLPAGSIPLMLVFFVIMPRTQYPMWNFLNRGVAGTTGFSETVRTGATSSVTEAKNIAFRAAMPQIDKNLLYWRGIVLNTFSDNIWSRQEPPDRPDTPRPGGKPLRITLFPEPQRGKYLIALNLPVRMEGIRARQSGDLVFTTGVPMDRRVRYDSLSLPVDTLNTGSPVDRQFYLRLPERLPPRISALGKSFAGNAPAEQKIAAIEKFYRTARLRYATTELPTGENALDIFLFDKKVGHCELFASSLAVLLRLADVPCRLVGGYYGGVYNDMGGYYVVTEEMAHVWVEAFLPGKGWVSIDPSAWSLGFARQETGGKGLLERMRISFDAVSYFWNLTVINYDLEKQVRLFNSTNDQIRRMDMKKAFFIILIPALAVSALYAGVSLFRRKKRSSREERILRRFFSAVAARYGVRKEDPSMGLHEFAALIDRPEVHEFVDIYGRVVFRDGKLSRDDYERLKRLIKGILGRE